MPGPVTFPTFAQLDGLTRSGLQYTWGALPRGIPTNAYGLTTAGGQGLFGGNVPTHQAIPVIIGKHRWVIPMGNGG
jgi:hypothetical protein